MPISIPMMQRRGSGGLGGDSGGRGGLFVPPHVLSRQESDGRRQEELGGAASVGGLGLSPTTAAKRERLFVRNQILRSTGFLEVQHSAPVIGEASGASGAAASCVGAGLLGTGCAMPTVRAGAWVAACRCGGRRHRAAARRQRPLAPPARCRCVPS